MPLIAALLLAALFQTGQSEFDQARRLLEAGRWADAEQAYRAHIKRFGASPEALANLGAALVKQEKFAEAVTQYRAAIRMAPQLTPIRLNLGLAWLKSGNRPAAIEEFTAYLKKEPANRQVLQLRAMALLDSDRYEDAAKDYQALLPSNDPTVLLGLGTAYLRQEKAAQAQAVLEPLLGGGSPEAELLLGQAMFFEGRLDDARAALLRAGQMKPDLPTLHLNLGSVYWRQQDTAAAIEEWRKEFELNPHDYQANYTLGAALAMSPSSSAEALPLLRKAVELKPRGPRALYQLAKLLWTQSKSSESVGLLERAVKADANYREGHYLLAAVYQSLGRRQEASREYAIVKRLSEEDARGARDLFESGR